MLIVSRVCAEFCDEKGTSIFSVQPNMRGILTEAPDAIRDTLLFRMLVSEGSLKAVEDIVDRKRLENDPMRGVDAEGKSQTDAALAKATARTARSGKSAKGTAAAESAVPADPADGTQLTMDIAPDTPAGDQ